MQLYVNLSCSREVNLAHTDIFEEDLEESKNPFIVEPTSSFAADSNLTEILIPVIPVTADFGSPTRNDFGGPISGLFEASSHIAALTVAPTISAPVGMFDQRNTADPHTKPASDPKQVATQRLKELKVLFNALAYFLNLDDIFEEKE